MLFSLLSVAKADYELKKAIREMGEDSNDSYMSQESRNNNQDSSYLYFGEGVFNRGARGDKEMLELIDNYVDRMTYKGDVHYKDKVIEILKYMGLRNSNGWNRSCSPYLKNAIKDRFSFLK